MVESRPLGRGGPPVPVIGQGTWQMELDRRSAIEALRRGLDLGLTHVDTAEMYGSGAVEELVGEAIAGRRDEVFLASKVLPYNGSHQGTLRACENSLARLATDRLDLYLLHGPSNHPLGETITAMAELRDAGKILAFGVSNFDVNQLDRAVDVAGPRTLACNQVCYHLKQRWIEHELIARCWHHGVAVVGYSPFGQGDFPVGDPVLGRIARAHGATERQVALRFLVRRPGVFTIPKSARIAHVEEIARAGDLELMPDELAEIDLAFPLGPGGGALPRL
ncbi:MAG: aldo/keto reductase [Actinomycetota bacterium]|nr:aldo/keto reductase [Actinomycetota bacterium]MDQ6947945.1 aldo/keto reductase [Actinomycetota bacterium]